MKNFTRCVLRWFFLTLFALPFAALIVRADVEVPASAVVLIGDSANFPDADVLTAAMLVYDELRKHGISVSEPVWEAPAFGKCLPDCHAPTGYKNLRSLERGEPRRNHSCGAADNVGRHRRDGLRRSEVGRCASRQKANRIYDRHGNCHRTGCTPAPEDLGGIPLARRHSRHFNSRHGHNCRTRFCVWLEL